MKNRMSPCKPCCKCPRYTFSFTEADGDIAGGSDDPAGAVTVASYTGKPLWKIAGNRLVYPAGGGSAGNADYPFAVFTNYAPTHYLTSIDITLPNTPSASAGIGVVTQTAVSGGTVNPLIWANISAAGAAFPDVGFLRLYKGSMGSFTLFSQFAIPVPGLVPGGTYRVSLCYNPESQVMGCSVTVGDVVFWHHAKDVELNNQTTSYSVRVWCDITKAGDYAFDNLLIQETKSIDTAADYYGGYSVKNTCHCCGPDGCSTITAPLTGIDDTQWFGGNFSGSTITMDGTKIETSNSNMKLIWNGSWSGRNDDCGPDRTMRVTARIAAPKYGDEYDVYVDVVNSGTFHSVRLKMASDSSETTPGSLTVLSQAGSVITKNISGLVEGADIEFTVCFDDGIITGIISNNTAGGMIDAEVESNNGLRWGIGTGTITNPAQFTLITANYNLLSANCPDCWGGGFIPGTTGVACANCDETPEFFMVTMSNVQVDPSLDSNKCLSDTTPAPPVNCGAINRSWLLSRRADQDYFAEFPDGTVSPLKACVWMIASAEPLYACTDTPDHCGQGGGFGLGSLVDGLPLTICPGSFVEWMDWCQGRWRPHVNPITMSWDYLDPPPRASPWAAILCDGHFSGGFPPSALSWYRSFFHIQSLEIQPAFAPSTYDLIGVNIAIGGVLQFLWWIFTNDPGESVYGNTNTSYLWRKFIPTVGTTVIPCSSLEGIADYVSSGLNDTDTCQWIPSKAEFAAA